MKRFGVVACLVLSLSACKKEGLDQILSTENERPYRESLNQAWAKMTPEQQEAYNWAVSDINLDQFFVRYPKATPRQVITQEADSYIALQSQKLAAATAELAQALPRLAEQEAEVAEVTAELQKIVAKPVGITKEWHRERFTYAITNNSRYDITTVDFDMWLFVDGEERSTRHCNASAYLKSYGGLKSGETKKSSVENGSIGCRAWDTLEVQNAKSITDRIDVNVASAEDFGERRILPYYSPSRADYQAAIDTATQQLAKAKAARDTLK